MPGGGVIAVPIGAGDRLRVVDVEGMQACELVAVDEAGIVDPAILGARGDRDATGLERSLSADSESARSARAGLKRRGIELADARAITLFGGDSRAGSAAEFAVSRDGLLLVAAPGAPMEAGAQATATPIRLHVKRSRILKPSETPLPEPLADPLQDIRVNRATAEAYVVRAGEYIQIIDVAGRQCSDFQCFSARKLDKGAERPLDATTTRSLDRPRLSAARPPGQGLRPGHGAAGRDRARHGRPPRRLRARLLRQASTRTWAIPATSTAPTISTPRSHPYGDRGAQGLDGAQLLLQHRRSTRITSSTSTSRGRARATTCCLRARHRSRLRLLGLPRRHRSRPMPGTRPTSMSAPIPTRSASRERSAYRMTPDAEPEADARDRLPSALRGAHARFHRVSRLLAAAEIQQWRADRRILGLPRARRRSWTCRRLRKFEVTGPDAEALMQYALTRDVRKLGVGQVVYSAMCYEHGGMLDDGTLFRLGAEQFPLDRRRRI